MYDTKLSAATIRVDFINYENRNVRKDVGSLFLVVNYLSPKYPEFELKYLSP